MNPSAKSMLTISHLHGSGGRQIISDLARRLNWTVWDREIEPAYGSFGQPINPITVLQEIRTFSLPKGASRERPLPFRHDLHQGVVCASCHGAPPELSARAADCAGCHADHHHEGATCSTCHAQPVKAVHPLTVHAGCAGAGCHEDAPFAGVPRSRTACLACHQDHADHKPGRECAACHAMPPASLVGPVGLAASSARR